MRCPTCHGWNPDTAAWCNQCARTLASVASDPAADAPGEASAVDADAEAPGDADAPGDAEVPSPERGGQDRGGVRVTAEGRIQWRCRRCEADNDMASLTCEGCGAGLDAGERRAVPELDEATWQRSRRRALAGPGLGHLGAGEGGLGCAVLALAVVWAGGGLGLLIVGGAAALPAAVVLLLGTAGLWASSAVDLARRRATGHALLTGRHLLWLVVAVTVLATVAVVLPGLGALT